MNIYISFLTNGKAKTLTVVGELGLSQKCSTAVKMILAEIHVSSDISMIYLTHSDLNTLLMNTPCWTKKAAKKVSVLHRTNRSTASSLREVVISLYLTLTRTHLLCCIQFWGPQYKEGINKLQRVQMIMRQEHSLCEKQLRKLGLFNQREDGFGVTSQQSPHTHEEVIQKTKLSSSQWCKWGLGIQQV